MKAVFPRWLVPLIVLVAGGSIALAADPTNQATLSTDTPIPTGPMLKVGDPAPPLQTGKFVQGDPVTKFQKGTAYIVEFWATWCVPCRESIPHLNQIYLKYKDKGLVVIGQDCSEVVDGQVEPFIKKMGDKMMYRVALDEKIGGSTGAMVETWMTAAGLSDLPTAFLVDTNGVIAWIGRTKALDDKLIDQVLAGTYDIKKAAAQVEQDRINDDRVGQLAPELKEAMKFKEWDLATAILNEIEKLLPEGDRDAVEMPRFAVAIGRKEYAAAYKIAQQTSDEHKDDARVQSDLAWEIAADPTIEQRDLALAETFAKRANDLAQGTDSDILDTLARVQFMRGKKDDAIATQTKAVSLADDGSKTGLQSTLDSYKKGELPKLGPPDQQ